MFSLASSRMCRSYSSVTETNLDSTHFLKHFIFKALKSWLSRWTVSVFRHTRIIKESSIFVTIPEGGIVLKDSNTMRRYSLHYSSVRSWLYCRWHFFNNCLGQAKYSWMYVVDCIRGETSFEGVSGSQRAKGSFPDGELNESSQKWEWWLSLWGNTEVGDDSELHTLPLRAVMQTSTS